MRIRLQRSGSWEARLVCLLQLPALPPRCRTPPCHSRSHPCCCCSATPAPRQPTSRARHAALQALPAVPPGCHRRAAWLRLLPLIRGLARTWEALGLRAWDTRPAASAPGGRGRRSPPLAQPARRPPCSPRAGRGRLHPGRPAGSGLLRAGAKCNRPGVPALLHPARQHAAGGRRAQGGQGGAGPADAGVSGGGCPPPAAAEVRPLATASSVALTPQLCTLLPPARRCCDAAKPFLAANCSSDATLLSILPGVGIQPAGLNSTLTVLRQACGI